MFCPRCGAEHSESARFCERCGQSLDRDDATTIAAAPVPRRRPTRDPRLIVAAAAAAVATLAVAAVALTGVVGSGDDAKRVAASATTSVPSTGVTTAAPTTQAPDTTPDTETNAEAPAAQPARATVKRTCGRNGVGGDCHLSVRASPSASARELKRLDEGDSLRLSCQVRGDRVFSSALGAASTVWSRTTDGGYVSNAYVAGPRVSARRMTLPRC
jgi:hypothetical protein